MAHMKFTIIMLGDFKLDFRQKRMNDINFVGSGLLVQRESMRSNSDFV